MDSIVTNLDTIIDYLTKILELIGGSAVISSIFPKAKELNTKGKVSLATIKKLLNVGIIGYNAIVAIANVFGFNFLAAKNKSANKIESAEVANKLIKGVAKK